VVDGVEDAASASVGACAGEDVETVATSGNKKNKYKRNSSTVTGDLAAASNNKRTQAASLVAVVQSAQKQQLEASERTASQRGAVVEHVRVLTEAVTKTSNDLGAFLSQMGSLVGLQREKLAREQEAEQLR
jgi:hypothetical protein